MEPKGLPSGPLATGAMSGSGSSGSLAPALALIAWESEHKSVNFHGSGYVIWNTSMEYIIWYIIYTSYPYNYI